MSTIFDYQKWEEIARRATSGDQVWDILASWKAECNALQKEIDELMDEHIGDVKCLCDFEYSIVPKIEDERDALQRKLDIAVEALKKIEAHDIHYELDRDDVTDVWHLAHEALKQLEDDNG